MAEKLSAEDYRILDWPDIAAVLPEVVWLNEGLNIAAQGRPFVHCGDAGSYKTWYAQYLLACAAAGYPVFGDARFAWRSRAIRCLYIDYEQGERESRSRFQRLAGGIRTRDLPNLHYVWQPIETWNPRPHERPKIISQLSKLLTGFDLVIVDSLLDSQPGTDENTSEIARACKLATKLSEDLGCQIGFIDHTSGKGQPMQNKSNSQRGHSAKKGASSVLYVASAVPDDPAIVTVTCERSQLKSREDWPKPLAYRLTNVNGGVTLELCPVPDVPVSTPVTPGTSRVKAILTELRIEPAASITALASRIGGRRTDVLSAIREMLLAGDIQQGNDGELIPGSEI